MTDEEYQQALKEETEDAAHGGAVLLGSSTAPVYTERESKKSNIVYDTVPAAFQLFNSAYNMAIDAVAYGEYEEDKSYDRDKDFKNYAHTLPLEYADNIRREAKSEDHAMFLVERANAEMHAQQMLFDNGAATGIGAALAASVFDIDTLAGAGMGAISSMRKVKTLTTADKVRRTKAAYKAGQEAMDYAIKHKADATEIAEVRKYMDDLITNANTMKQPRHIGIIEKYARMAGGAGLASAVTEGALSSSQITYEDDMLPAAVLSSVVLAPVMIGSIATTGRARAALVDKVNASKGIVHKEIVDSINNMHPHTYGVYDSDMPEPIFKNLGMDASKQPEVDSDIDNFLSKVDSAPAPKNIVGTWVDKLGTALEKTPIAGSFYKLKNSSSKTARALAHMLLEDPQGKTVGQSMAMRSELYYRRAEGGFSVQYDEAYKGWAKAQGMNHMDIIAGVRKSEFDKNVSLELNNRWHNYPTSTEDAHVLRAADASSGVAQRALDIAKGKSGELGIDGYRDITDNAGYFPLKHTKVRDAVVKHGKDTVIDLYTKGYKAAGIDDALAPEIAAATVRRAVAKSEDIDMSTIGMLDNEDARVFLKEMLMDGGISEDRANNIIDGLRVPLEERGKMSSARRRVPIDLSVEEQLPNGESLSMLDMVDTDMATLYQKYARSISGQASLARVGLTNKMQQRTLVNKILAEQLDNPTNNMLSRENIEDVLAHFNGVPVSGAPSEMQRFAQGMTRLMMLGRLGLTQLGELGVVFGSNLLQNFSPSMRGLTGAFRRVSSKAGTAADKALCDELTEVYGRIGADHDIFRGDLSLELIHNDTSIRNKYALMANNMLKRGERLQGFTSLFYAVQGASQRIAVEGGIQKIFKGVRDSSMSDARLYSTGLKENHVKYIRGLIDDGIVEFKDGHVYRLNTDKWDEAFKDDFGAILLRHQHQVVQKAMAGESNLWMSKSMGSFLAQLQNYTITSVSKQFVRNMRIADQEAIAIAVMSTITAGAAYSAKLALSGDWEDKDFHDIAKGAISYGAYTGWIPPVHDSAMTLMGLNDFKFNTFGSRGNGEIIKPPVLSAMNGVYNMPAAAIHMATGAFTKTDANNLQLFPILGRAYLMDRIIESQVVEPEEE